MRFYNRESELQLLNEAVIRSEKRSQMTVLFGRRRIGKTLLALKSVENNPHVYLFVGRKSEPLLCQEFISEIENSLGIKVHGEFKQFSKLLELLLMESGKKAFTIILDEFQDFQRINPGVFSDIQNCWDRHRNRSHVHLIISGSAHSLMKKIFEGQKEPLFGRADERIHLKPFPVKVIRQIMADHAPEWKPEDLLAFYVLTGGVAKYAEIFADRGCFTLDGMLNEIFRENSLLIDEGRNLLIEELGKEYLTYFTILSLIATSKTSRSEIESVLEKDAGGYLDRLEKEYSILSAVKPIGAKPGGRQVRYRIEDHFLNFWFRFIYKYRSAVEIGNYQYIKNIVIRDFSTYSGRFLEKYFHDLLIQSGKYSAVGSWWDRKSQNEIDIIAVNEELQTILIGDVKLNPAQLNLAKLKTRSALFLQAYPNYRVEWQGFSMEGLRD